MEKVLKTAALTYGEETAQVKFGVDDKGNSLVQVEKEEGVTTMAPKYTYKETVKKFEQEGWVKVAETDTDEIVQIANEYILLHKEKTALERKMEKLKKEVRKYMEDTNMDTLEAEEGRIVLQSRKQPNTTSLYSDYLVEDVKPLLPEKVYFDVTELRVNSEKLESALKLHSFDPEVVKEIKAKKINIEGKPSFTVRKN